MPLGGKELEAFLDEPHLAHFATTGSDGNPRVRPLWFCFAEGALWFTTRLEARRTGADVAAGSAVAVSIASDERPYRAVLAYGTPEVWESLTEWSCASFRTTSWPGTTEPVTTPGCRRVRRSA